MEVNWDAQRRMDRDAEENREMYEAFAGEKTMTVCADCGDEHEEEQRDDYYDTEQAAHCPECGSAFVKEF